MIEWATQEIADAVKTWSPNNMVYMNSALLGVIILLIAVIGVGARAWFANFSADFKEMLHEIESIKLDQVRMQGEINSLKHKR